MMAILLLGAVLIAALLVLVIVSIQLSTIIRLLYVIAKETNFVAAKEAMGRE